MSLLGMKIIRTRWIFVLKCLRHTILIFSETNVHLINDSSLYFCGRITN